MNGQHGIDVYAEAEDLLRSLGRRCGKNDWRYSIRIDPRGRERAERQPRPLAGPLEGMRGSHILRLPSHNPESVVAEARATAERCMANHVVAVGGSSSIDLGKAIVDGLERPLVLSAVPTTLGGSEMSRIYGLLTSGGQKAGGAGSSLLPETVCYDPRLLSTMPSDVLGGSGINAWAHAVEAHYSRKEHWLGRAAAVAAGRELASLLTVPGGRLDFAYWESLARAAHLAGFALNANGMGVHHAICHVLGGATELPHGLLNAVALAPVLRANQAAAPDATAATSMAFGLDGSLADTADRLRERFGMPRTLSGLLEAAISPDKVAEHVRDAPHLRTNPSSLSEETLLALIREIIGA